MPGARWFAGARLNYAEHALRAGAGDDVAVVEHDEEGPRGELTWDELRAAVGARPPGLRERGDRPRRPRGRLPAQLRRGRHRLPGLREPRAPCGRPAPRTCSLPRPWTASPSCARPALIACDGYRYGGRAHDRRAAVAELAGPLDSLRVR
jgi:acetoacetyl-CoA synthetase